MQGTAFGPGGGSTDWEWEPENAVAAAELWTNLGLMGRVGGHAGGQQVDDIADVHIFIVTRPAHPEARHRLLPELLARRRLAREISRADVSISTIAIRRRGETAREAGAAGGDSKGEATWANFVFAYKGGSMAETPEAQEAAMKAWGEWFGTLGSAVVEMGNPFGPSTAVQADGSSGTATAGLSGYSAVEADSLELAAKLAGGCPILANGGSVEVYEAIEM